MAYRKEELITASEVARYVYCRRAWVYDRKGVRTQRRGLLRWLAIAVIIVIILVLGVLIATQMMGSGS